MHRVPPFVLMFLLAGCATPLPESLREPPPSDIALSAARESPTAYIGQRVRWGGEIAGVENRPNQTCLEIVGRELENSGRPRDTDRSLGRFIACVPEFLDPAVYAQSRDVTVAGTINGIVVRDIGEHPYRYVTVSADSVYLWEPRIERGYVYRGPYYDPFWYDPFWSWRPYPYAPYPYW